MRSLLKDDTQLRAHINSQCSLTEDCTKRVHLFGSRPHARSMDMVARVSAPISAVCVRMCVCVGHLGCEKHTEMPSSK